MGWISNVLQIREEIWIFNVEVSRHECRRRQVRLDDLKDVAVEIVATVEEQEIDVGVRRRRSVSSALPTRSSTRSSRPASARFL